MEPAAKSETTQLKLLQYMLPHKQTATHQPFGKSTKHNPSPLKSTLCTTKTKTFSSKSQLLWYVFTNTTCAPIEILHPGRRSTAEAPLLLWSIKGSQVLFKLEQRDGKLKPNNPWV